MTGLHLALVAQRQLRAETAPRCCAARRPPRLQRALPRLLATIGINGFGPMGRLALRAAWDALDFEVGHITS